MPLCASAPATVDTDTNSRGLFLNDLDKCMKNFNEALTSTMNSYRGLLTAFDQVAQVYGNIAQQCSDEARKPVGEFREGMRNLKDKGGFETFNSEIHSGTIAVMDPVKRDLKKALKSYKSLHSKQKEYDSVRFKLEKTEKSYAKKDKPLAESGGYKKTLAKRDKSKSAYEKSRDDFAEEVAALQLTTKSVLLQSLNNYLHCTATFCGQLEATMNGYRTDVDTYGATAIHNTNMDRLKERAEAESTARRAKRQSAAASQVYPTEGDSKSSPNKHPNVPATADDDFYPKKENVSSENAHPHDAGADSVSPIHPQHDDSVPNEHAGHQAHDDLRHMYDNGAAAADDDAINPLAPGAADE